MNRLVYLVQSLFARAGLVVLRKRSFQDLQRYVDLARRYAILSYFEDPILKQRFMELEAESQAQLHQDLVAGMVAGFKNSGFFVEFGATDGKTLSNTFMLEKELGWSGVLAEPGREWHDELRSNRDSQLVKKAVWSKTGEELDFVEDGELSTLTRFRSIDKNLRKGLVYMVNTISLLDLLVENDAPREIDFLSIDTEGSEFAILEAFDFSKYTFNFICVEHNFTPQENRIEELLASNGYQRVLADVSGWDAWFVRSK